MAVAKTPKYPHPDGAQITKATVTVFDVQPGPVEVDIWWSKDQHGAGEIVKTVIVEEGNHIGFKALPGQWMEPLQSLVWATFPDEIEGIMIIIGFGRKY